MRECTAASTQKLSCVIERIRNENKGTRWQKIKGEERARLRCAGAGQARLLQGYKSGGGGDGGGVGVGLLRSLTGIVS